MNESGYRPQDENMERTISSNLAFLERNTKGWDVDRIMEQYLASLPSREELKSKLGEYGQVKGQPLDITKFEKAFMDTIHEKVSKEVASASETQQQQ
jgi:hypothetical protein